MAAPFVTTDADFGEKVLESDLPVLVDFWAEWCAPCKMIAPIVEELSEEYDGKLRFAKLDVDSNRTTVTTYNIIGMPTLLIFKDGKPVGQIVGAFPKGVLKQKIDSILEE